ncbi:4-(cytidine 5'-diphospho)-2-C-methyl-D-erythritol kinase [Sphingomonas sp. NSE70-1]|uniref:4-diphosphocytidyl-2-C-methyl-D-erythritol kinase n=2 Tax=Sphingomonas caseinilyticus TaxID=2908205 RepID=A0ABT0RR93_9SPHN|nr:4-(cytidine 5'-diphospho)-2-C-methyl-D-erythritol kinase [Sphingomonas caseinilyticus]MCL6697533.1 4-(cytidine 5'-diphospho)-2-C-methyl-D-erythritol kinase [Sphingomonas caseinilyticus]
MMKYSEPAPAKLNLALHVRGKLPDGRHSLETIFAFCIDGDRLEAEKADELNLSISGPFAEGLSTTDNLVLDAAKALKQAAGVDAGASLYLTKKLPVASGIGGGSADAAAALRLLTGLWGIDPRHAVDVAPAIGSDVPACLLSLSAKGTEAGDKLELVQDPSISGTPALLVNPLVPLSTGAVFAAWDGIDRGPLGDWRRGRNDLEAAALTLAPDIGHVLDWLGTQPGAGFIRMSGSGATCFALFDSEAERDAAAATCPSNWWHLATFLR